MPLYFLNSHGRTFTSPWHPSGYFSLPSPFFSTWKFTVLVDKMNVSLQNPLTAAEAPVLCYTTKQVASVVEGFGSPSSPVSSLGFIFDISVSKRCRWKAVEMLGRGWSVWWRRRRRNWGSGLIKSGEKEGQERVNLPAVFHHVMGLGRCGSPPSLSPSRR